MRPEALNFIAAAASYSADEREEIALQLLHGEADAVPALSPEWDAEIKRRLEGYKQGRIKGVSWEEAWARLERRRESD